MHEIDSNLLLDHTIDQELIDEETRRIKDEIRSFNKDTPYYVYFLCFPNGQPFYVGKGKHHRGFDHFKSDKNNKRKTKVINDIIEAGSYPILYIADSNLTEVESYTIEDGYIKEYGRIGIDANGILTNIFPGFSEYTPNDGSSIGGKIGGTKTKSLGKGIFSDDWDRSAHTKACWASGNFDHVDFSEAGKIGGSIARDLQLGIHDPKYDNKRSEWAKIAAEALNESGNRSGIFTKEWRQQNPEKAFEIASKAGKAGGKTTGEKSWWNNGESNIRSIDWPGDGWVHGMLMSEKKKAQCALLGQCRPTAGKKCINNGVRNKMVNPEEVEQYISEGWVKGKIKITKEEK